MEGEPKAGVSVTPSTPGSGLAAAGWAVVAIVALLALVDAAVETFWSGSPLRWWVAPSVLVFIALGVWLWRPGGWAAKRWGWEGGAAWSICGLLLLLAATAWMPGGQTAGVRMLLQPAPRVLAGVILIGVVLAAYVLFLAAGLLQGTARLIARAVVAVLAVYALASLFLALREHTPFGALFQGGAAWQRLPSWLQGTFIGAFALLPLALLGQTARIVDHLRRRQSVRVLLHQATALVMALVMALAGVPPSGSAATKSRPVDARPALTVREAAKAFEQVRRESVREALGSSADAARSAEQTVDQLQAAFGTLEKLLAKLPRTGFDMQAVVEQVGRDPSRLFEWVRDETTWVPYRGELRGATGVLMDRKGNSLDRALLLAALLRIAGLNVRLAHGTLAAPQVDVLLAAVRRPLKASSSPEAEADLRGALEGAQPLLKLNAEELQSVLSRRRQGAARLADAVRDAAEFQSSRLMGILPKPTPKDGAVDREAAADHWWAQVEQSGAWTDLDPSLPTSRVGATLTAPSERVRPEALAPELRHRVAVTVVVEQLANGRLGERVALEEVLDSADLVGVPVSLVNVPRDPKRMPQLLERATSSPSVVQWAQAEKEWQPVLLVGDRAITQKAFGTTGSLLTTQAEGTGTGGPSGTAPPTGLMSGFLGGEEHQSAKSSSQADAESGELTAEWIEYEFRVPGKQARRVRREVFDLIGPAVRAAGRLAADQITEMDRFQRALGLLSTTEVAVLSGGLSREFLTLRRASALLASRSWMARAASKRGKATAEDLSALARELRATPGPEFDLAVARDIWSPTTGNIYLAEPNVIAMHKGFSGRSLEALRGFVAFDVVSNEVAVMRDAKAEAYELRLRQGVFDSVVENMLIAKPCCGLQGGAPEVEAPEGPLGREWALVRSPTDVKAAGLSPEAQARIAAEVAAGYVVVAGGPDPESGSRWWRVDPNTGSTVAIGSRGWGQFVEYVQQSYEAKGGAYFVWELVKAIVCLGVTVGLSIKHQSPLSMGFGLVMCAAAATMGFSGAATWAGGAEVQAARHAVHIWAIRLEQIHYFIDAMLETMEWAESHLE